MGVVLLGDWQPLHPWPRASPATRPSQGSPALGLSQADRWNIDPVPGGSMFQRSGPGPGVTAATARQAGRGGPAGAAPPGRQEGL